MSMEASLQQVVADAKELDSELLEDKSTILGVVCADDEGNCLEVNGRISPLTANLAASLAQIAAELEPGNLEQPVIVLDKTDKTQLIIKKEESATIAISKQQSSKKLEILRNPMSAQDC